MPGKKGVFRQPAEQMLELINGTEVVSAIDICERDPRRSPKSVLSAVYRLCDQGLLFYAGTKPNRFNIPMKVFTRDPSKAQPMPRTRAEVSALRRQEAEAKRVPVPFVALFTPPLPKFRIKATRVLRPLSSPVEDAA